MSSVQAGAAAAREAPPTNESQRQEWTDQQRHDASQQASPEMREPESSPHPRVDEHAGPTDADVARRAYELYLARGGADGADVDDWLQAEYELRALPR